MADHSNTGAPTLDNRPHTSRSGKSRKRRRGNAAANALAQGLFVSFEGGEGTGKTTQLKALARHFEDQGLEVVTTREPGGSPAAEAIRAALLDGAAKPLGPLGEAALFAAARADHVRRVITPALKKGAVVLCDRFADSTRVYQGVAGGLAAHQIDRLEQVGTLGVMPHLTLVLDLPPEVGLGRARQRNAALDRFESEDAETHERINEGFRRLCERFPERCHLVDAQGSSEAVGQRILDAVEHMLEQRAAAPEPEDGC